MSDTGASVTGNGVADNEIEADQTEDGGCWQVSHDAQLATFAFRGDALEYCVDGSDPCEQAIAGDAQLMIVPTVTAGDANGDGVVNALA